MRTTFLVILFFISCLSCSIHCFRSNNSAEEYTERETFNIKHYKIEISHYHLGSGNFFLSERLFDNNSNLSLQREQRIDENGRKEAYYQNSQNGEEWELTTPPNKNTFFPPWYYKNPSINQCINEFEERVKQYYPPSNDSLPQYTTTRRYTIIQAAIGICFISLGIYELYNAYHAFYCKCKKKRNNKWVATHATVATLSLGAGFYLLYTTY